MAAIYIECDMAAKATGLTHQEIADMAGYDRAAEWIDAHPRAVELIATAAERNGRPDYAELLRHYSSAANAATPA